MSETTSVASVNSRPWWDDYFVHHWEPNNGRGQTAHFMERVVANLPGAEVAYLSSEAATILDWGCACGDGVAILAKAFPRCHVFGLDYSRAAIAKARQAFPQHEFQPSEDGEISSAVDVVITSNCLEHFVAPLDIIQKHLRSCRALYVLLVPYREVPLCESHFSQFREECFPECLNGFTRIVAKVIDVASNFWGGQQLLVIYGSPSYLRRRDALALRAQEQEKWDSFYSLLPVQPMNASVQKFGEELAETIEELLPAGSSVLEAGCGGGSQSMILAERNKLRVTLMDFAPAAVQFAQWAFEQRGLSAAFLCEDVFVPGQAEHDLVFNAGVLDHYSFDKQVAFLRGMASRSRKYVLALVPNRHCYWYWIWRIQAAANGAWPYGKEVPMADLSGVFTAAGLNFVGQCFCGSSWSEDFIRNLPGIDKQLCEQILTVHRSPIIPEREKGYLVAALGCKGESPSLPQCWCKPSQPDSPTHAELTAGICDALAEVIAAESRQQQAAIRLNEIEALRSQQLAEKDAQLAAKDAQLNAILNSDRWRLACRLQRIRRSLMALGSSHKRVMHVGIRMSRTLKHSLGAAFRGVATRSRAAIRMLVPATLRPYARRAEDQVRRTLARVDRHARVRALRSILNVCGGRKGIVVLPPLVNWDWMKQRPHHLLGEFARAGYLVFFCSPQTRADRFRGFQRVAESLYLCSCPEVLNQHLQSPIVLATCPGHLEHVQKFKQPRVIYDHLDDLRVHCEGNRITGAAIAQHEALLRMAEVVCTTAERLYMRVQAIRPDAILCPNGVHYDDFALNAVPQVPDDLKTLVADGRPIVGYYGALAKWFDYGLLTLVAERCPQYHFVLIGPNYDGSLDRRLLAKIHNLHWLGEKKYEALPEYAYYFGVATIPFLINEITQCTSPVKLFEYMAAGKPIVTTDLPECRKYRSVFRASNAAEFVAQLDTAIKRGSDPQYREILLAEARANTWRARFELIEARLNCGFRQESYAA